MIPDDHAAEVTARLRADNPPLGLADNEAVCPRCTLVFKVRDGIVTWGVCPDCVGDAIARSAE